MNRKKILKLTALSLAVYTSSNLVDVGSIIARADDSIIQEVKDEINNNGTNNDETTGDSVVLEKENKNELAKINNDADENVIYSNDFEDGSLPDELGGVLKNAKAESVEIAESKAIKINSKFDGTDNWDTNKHELAFYADSSDEIPTGSIIQFDVLIPEDKANYEGIIKYSGGIGDKNWNWKVLDMEI